MASYGFTPAGPVPQTTAIIAENLRAALRGEYGAGVPLGCTAMNVLREPGQDARSEPLAA